MKCIKIKIKAQVDGAIEIPDNVTNIQDYLDALWVDIFVGADGMDKTDLGANQWTIEEIA